MKYKVVFIITSIVIVAVLLIVSWQLKKKPVPCSQIKEMDLFSISTPGDMEMWLENNTQLTRNDVYISSIEDMTMLRWEENGSTYYAYFRDDKVKNIHIDWKVSEPTLIDVLNCLGSPDSYYAEYSLRRGGTLFIDLWYLDEGFLVTSTHFGRQKQPVVVDENTIMNGIYFVATPSDSVEKMNEGLKPAIYTHHSLDVLEPWPGNLEDIVVVDLTQ